MSQIKSKLCMEIILWENEDVNMNLLLFFFSSKTATRFLLIGTVLPKKILNYQDVVKHSFGFSLSL